MRSFRIFFGLVILLVAAGRLFGQAGATGTILGTVTDSTGAIIPDVKVTVTNTETNQVFRTNTSSSGDYLAPALNPGTYTVSAESKGFQKSVTTSFILTVSQKIRVDLALKAGAVTETLEVTAQAVALDTDSAALSQLVSQQQVEELPLNGRNFMQLLLVGAGAVTVGGEQGTMRQGEGNAISVNGGRPEGNSYTLDGLVNTDPALVTPAVILSQDAIQEFKVESGTYPAEYGFSASQINIVSKGGTNKPHGAIFEDNRNDAYDAKPFPNINDFNNGAATTLPILRQNQFGFVASGPVFIPKLYDGRNKTFFMVNYEGWRINNGGIATESLPNPAILQGNFGAETYPAGLQNSDKTITLPGGPLPLYGTANCGILLDNGYNCMPVDPLTGAAFPSNTIPAARFVSRIGQVAVKHNFWATPTLLNQPEGINNFRKNYPGTLTTNQQTYRGDQNLGKLGSVFGRFTYSKYTNHSLYNSGSLDYGIESYFENQKAWAVSHTINIGQSNVNNFRFGYLDAFAPESSQTPPSTLAGELNQTGVFTKFGPLQETWPNVGLSAYSSGGGPGNSYSGSDSPAWEWADSFTTVHGRHTIGIGVDYRTYSLTRNLADDFYGDWGFSGSTARGNSAAGSCPNPGVTLAGATASAPLCGTGHAVADMMLGYYSGVSGFFPGALSPTDQAGNPQTHLFHYFAPYAQDDWKVTPKLTLSIGLRWDYRAATSEAKNHFFWLDTKNANGGLCFADPVLSTNGVAPGGPADGSNPVLRYCGSVPHAGSKKPFAPRFGMNYRLTDKTVLRGGYGIFYDSYEGREIDDSADIYPYSVRNSLNPTGDATLAKNSNQMFPSYTTLGRFPLSTLSFIAVIESENPLNPYVNSWTASVQREVARNTTLEVNYIGTHSVHLLDRHNIAQPYALAAADQPFCQHKDGSGNYDNLDKPPCAPRLQNPAGSGLYPRLQYKNFTNFYINSDFHGYAHYNAMNIKLEHRAGDMALTTVYTWANSKDDKSATAGVGASGTGYQGFMDNHNTKLDYGPSDFDVDQRFVASYIYYLPIGRGKKFAASSNKATDLVIGGWEVTGITTFQTGFPFGVSSNDIGGVQATVAPRPNKVSGCNPHANLTGKLQRLNMACFSQQPPGTFGNTTRNFLRQPGINNWDMGFAKNFHFTESLNFKLSVDTFNTFNHHQYAGDVGGLVVGGSGGNSVIDNSVNSATATAGRITGSSAPRILQLGGKITF